MSDKTPSPELAAVPTETETETKQSIVVKTKTFVKNHKKPLIAVGALAALVGVSAVTGRKTATVTVQSPLEIDVDSEAESEDQSA